jgi:predicted SAM-dependent methyltransferase
MTRRRLLRRYLESTDVPRLEIGAGVNRLPGWLGSDLYVGDIYLDLRRPLPLPDSSFVYVYGEQVIEHIPEADAVALFAELRRIIRPGGVLRLATPDLQRAMEIYRGCSPHLSLDEYRAYLNSIAPGPHDSAAQIFNSLLRSWGHQFIYDADDLSRKLQIAGFETVEPIEAGESAHEHLRGIERHGGPAGDRADTMCIEAS